MTNPDVNSVVQRTKEYYDGPADEIYSAIWGGGDVHLGIPPYDGASFQEAMANTNRIMAEAVSLDANTRVIDMGSGYGSTARFLAKTYGCQVVASNLSEKENQVSQEEAEKEGVGHLVSAEYGDFHDLPYEDHSFDVVWSQEAFLHGADKHKILSEAHRVLKPGGTLVFTDILVSPDTPDADRQRIYERLRTSDIWGMDAYRDALQKAGFKVQEVRDWSEYVAPSYSWVRDTLKQNRETMVARAGEETVDSQINALTFWVDSANAGLIGWGLFVATKPA
ncbi:MAG: methyltransferase domain-containing protein [Chloroflexota bacterium]